MKSTIFLDAPLAISQVASVAMAESALRLSEAARARITAARAIVESVIEKSIRAYGVNTGVGALSDVIIPPTGHADLSRNILLSHAVGLGESLGRTETRAIMVAMVNNFALGYSGLRLCVVERLLELLAADCTPRVPRQGSVGYISHAAHIGLALIGRGTVILVDESMPAAEALSRLGIIPLVLEAKEGLCLVNGTPCVTGLGCLAIERAERLLTWADYIAAMTFETQRGQLSALATAAMALRLAPGLQEVSATLNRLLGDSEILAAAKGRRTQDALSLRAIPQIHGAVWDAWGDAARVVQHELGSVTDNPIVAGTPVSPEIYSQAHAVGASIGLALDQLAVCIAELAAHSGSRLDRMVNPLLSGLPPFLARTGGTESGFMVAQYTAVSLIGENRRLASPAALDGGTTSGLQEDMLCHATPAALKVLQIINNSRHVLAIELLAASQSYDILDLTQLPPAIRTRSLYQFVRSQIPTYADDRPLGEDIAATGRVIEEWLPGEVLATLGLH